MSGPEPWQISHRCGFFYTASNHGLLYPTTEEMALNQWYQSRPTYFAKIFKMTFTGSGRMIYPFLTGHQARCSNRKRSSHVSLSSTSFAISVFCMAWSTEHRVFMVETCFKCGDSVIAAQRQFCTHFGISRHGRVPNRKPYCGYTISNRPLQH